jgi:hypothetical protein
MKRIKHVSQLLLIITTVSGLITYIVSRIGLSIYYGTVNEFIANIKYYAIMIVIIASLGIIISKLTEKFTHFKISAFSSVILVYYVIVLVVRVWMSLKLNYGSLTPIGVIIFDDIILYIHTVGAEILWCVVGIILSVCYIIDQNETKKSGVVSGLKTDTVKFNYLDPNSLDGE